MIPPFLNSLGPITDWLGGMMLGPLIKKYDAINQASSAAKVTLVASLRGDQFRMSILCCCKAQIYCAMSAGASCVTTGHLA